VHRSRAGSGLKYAGLGFKLWACAFCRSGFFFSKIGLKLFLSKKVRPAGLAQTPGPVVLGVWVWVLNKTPSPNPHGLRPVLKKTGVDA
jgi:hypothetical protein